MNKLICQMRGARLLRAIRLSLFAVIFVTGGQASAQLLQDSANLKILSARTKLMQSNNRYFMDQIKSRGAPVNPSDAQSLLQSIGGCGNVQIGNSYGSSGSMGADISVIITGDILNVGNRCGL
jgi:hypothetical protein